MRTEPLELFLTAILVGAIFVIQRRRQDLPIQEAGHPVLGATGVGAGVAVGALILIQGLLG